MKKILPLLIILIAGAIGGGGGYFLKTSQTPPAAGLDQGGHESADNAEAHGGIHGKESKKKKNKKDSGHGEPSPDAAYMKFSRQFVVTLVEGGASRGMIILDINIEVDSALAASAYTMEPKLRDAFLGVLIKFSQRGELAGLATSPTLMEQAKVDFLHAAKEILGDGAISVLITDVAIQYR